MELNEMDIIVTIKEKGIIRKKFTQKWQPSAAKLYSHSGWDALLNQPDLCYFCLQQMSFSCFLVIWDTLFFQDLQSHPTNPVAFESSQFSWLSVLMILFKRWPKQTMDFPSRTTSSVMGDLRVCSQDTMPSRGKKNPTSGALLVAEDSYSVIFQLDTSKHS